MRRFKSRYEAKKAQLKLIKKNPYQNESFLIWHRIGTKGWYVGSYLDWINKTN